LNNPTELYNTFDKANHLLPEFEKSLFDSLHSWDFGWEILQTINIASSEDDDKLLSKRFSPGQKALYFFWYLDAQVTNGGFIQFYFNGYQKYIPPIIEGLKLIDDERMLLLIEKSEKLYLMYEQKFSLYQKEGDWKPLYDELKEFEDFDASYYKLHDTTMSLIERYARNNVGEFVRFKKKSIFKRLFK
jgi:hypothetical protein